VGVTISDSAIVGSNAERVEPGVKFKIDAEFLEPGVIGGNKKIPLDLHCGISNIKLNI
jgi:hypothetical protein